jgi:hypothetical protein
VLTGRLSPTTDPVLVDAVGQLEQRVAQLRGVLDALLVGC